MNKRKLFSLNKLVNATARDNGVDFVKSYSYNGAQIARNKLYSVSGKPKHINAALDAIENIRGVNFVEYYNGSIFVYYHNK